MRLIFGNSCARGCLVYIVVLAGVLFVGSMGLDGLRARFGMNRPELTTMSAGASVPGVEVTLPNPADVLGSGGGGSAGTGGLAIPSGDGGDGGLVIPTATPIPLPLPAPVPQPAPQPTPGQGGTITGEVSQPFYIVRPGDTLWSISQQVGVSVDALRAANGITGDIIYPGQVLVLPAPGTTPPGAPHTGGGPPPLPGTGQQEEPDPSVPNMPHTGIIPKKP